MFSTASLTKSIEKDIFTWSPRVSTLRQDNIARRSFVIGTDEDGIALSSLFFSLRSFRVIVAVVDVIKYRDQNYQFLWFRTTEYLTILANDIMIFRTNERCIGRQKNKKKKKREGRSSFGSAQSRFCYVKLIP